MALGDFQEGFSVMVLAGEWGRQMGRVARGSTLKIWLHGIRETDLPMN